MRRFGARGRRHLRIVVPTRRRSGPLGGPGTATLGPTGQYSSRQAAYDLKKLRGKTLVHKIGKSRRYEAPAQGLRTLVALGLLRDKVLKPVQRNRNPAGDRPATTTVWSPLLQPPTRNASSVQNIENLRVNGSTTNCRSKTGKCLFQSLPVDTTTGNAATVQNSGGVCVGLLRRPDIESLMFGAQPLSQRDGVRSLLDTPGTPRPCPSLRRK